MYCGAPSLRPGPSDRRSGRAGERFVKSEDAAFRRIVTGHDDRDRRPLFAGQVSPVRGPPVGGSPVGGSPVGADGRQSRFAGWRPPCAAPLRSNRCPRPASGWRRPSADRHPRPEQDRLSLLRFRHSARWREAPRKVAQPPGGGGALRLRSVLRSENSLRCTRLLCPKSLQKSM